MSYAQWGHKESHPNRHGRGEGKGTPAPGKNARGKKAKYSISGSSRSQPWPDRAEAREKKELKTNSPQIAARKKTAARRAIENSASRAKGKPGVRASEMKAVRARLHGNPTHHFIGRR